LVKGIVQEGEDDIAAAVREFEEETGWRIDPAGWVPLGETVLRSRKTVVAWAIETDFDLDTFQPGMFMLYGREHPEIDVVSWMTPEEARVKLNPAQTVFVDRLVEHLQLNGVRGGPP
jgi:predicted NUDIX family NTP pyrophosphohydrolase